MADTDPIQEMRAAFDAAMQSEGLYEDPRFEGVRKLARKLGDELSESLAWWAQDELHQHLAHCVQDWAERAVKALLAGNEQALRRYLNCERQGFTGRDHIDLGYEGELIALRRKIAEANEAIIRDERILDLEAIVAKQAKELAHRENVISIQREKLREGGLW